MSEPEMSAVVVAWNSGESLSSCLEALRASADQAGREVEMVVVDNGSSDDSAERAQAAGAKVVRNPLNAGYGVAAAQGMARVNGRWVLLLNPDVVVDVAFVGELLEAATSAGPDVATLVPDVRFASDRSVVNCRGVEVDDVGIPAEVEAGRRVEAEALEPRAVFGGSSGACLLRIDALRRVGGVEVCFFAYLEDVDLAWRLQRAGYRALLVPAAVAYHEGSASVGEGSPTKAFLVARNRRVLFRLDGPATFRARGWRTAIELGHAAVTSLGGAGSAPSRGRLDAVRLRRYTRFVKSSRTLTEPIVREPALAPRAGLGETLRRKRAISREMHRAERHSPRPR